MLKPEPRPVVHQVFEFLRTRTAMTQFERILQWSLLVVCLFYRGDANHLEIGVAWISAWWPFGS